VYTYTHTHIHIDMHVYIHTRTHTCTYAHGSVCCDARHPHLVYTFLYSLAYSRVQSRANVATLNTQEDRCLYISVRWQRCFMSVKSKCWSLLFCHHMSHVSRDPSHVEIHREMSHVSCLMSHVSTYPSDGKDISCLFCHHTSHVSRDP